MTAFVWSVLKNYSYTIVEIKIEKNSRFFEMPNDKTRIWREYYREYYGTDDKQVSGGRYKLLW